MPRRYYHYQPQFQIYHVISSLGSYVMLLGFLIMAAYLVHSLFRGRKAPANPWGGASLEWACASPPPYDNFAQTPVAGDPYDFSGLKYDAAIGGYVPRTAAGGEG